MMVRSNLMVSKLCFAAEGLSGMAAAASLRKLGGLMEQAPSGRLFAAIFTLSDLSAKAAAELEDGSRAMGRSHDGEAVAQLATAVTRMETLAATVKRHTGKARRRATR